MTGACPRCNTLLELQATGHYRCERCGIAFEAYVAQPGPALSAPRARIHPHPGLPSPNLGPQPTTPGGPPSAATGACPAHAHNPAVDVCERCGDFMCEICRTVVEGRRYCPSCFEILFARGSLLFAQRSFGTPGYALMTGGIALASMCLAGCYGLVSLPGGIIGIILGISALREISRRPDLPGRGMAIAGIVCGALALLSTVAFYVVLIVSVLASNK